MPSILAAPERHLFVLSSSTATVRDFTRYDAYLDDLGVLFLPGEGRKDTRTLELRPPKTDIGQTEFEARPEFGDWFSQGDFSHGMGQRFFHRPGRDPAKYHHAEGFDISEPGILKHLWDSKNTSTNFNDPVAIEEFNGLPFVLDATDHAVWRGDGTFPGTWTSEDPLSAEVADAEYSMATNGQLLFAALGTNGVHVRDTAGTWDHLHTATPTDLNTGDTRVVRWLKDRLMVIGTGGREIFEVVVDDTGQCDNAAPTAIETLPTGWLFHDIFEAGPFIFACAVNETAGMSRVHAYGLNSGATAIEKKTSTPLPAGHLAYSGIGALGRVFIGGGRLNEDNGINPVLYEAFPNDTGELQLLLINAEDDDDANDLPVKCFEVLSDAVIFGWARGSTNIHGRFTGLGYYNLARNAWTYHLARSLGADHAIADVTTYKGRTLYAIEDVGVAYEDIGVYETTAFIESSIADWNNAGRKVWDLFEVMHHPLPVQTSVQVQYTRRNPDLLEWQDIFTSDIPGAMGAVARLEDVTARTLALKLTSTATSSETPEIQAFSARSLPAPEETEWRVVRTIRVLGRDRKDQRAEAIKQDPRTVKSQILSLAHSWVTFYEPGSTFTAYVENVRETEPGSSALSETEGSSGREAYFFQIEMVARRVG